MRATAALPLAIAREETSATGKALPALVVPAGLVNPSWVAQRVAASQCHPFVKEGPAAAGGLQGRQPPRPSTREAGKACRCQQRGAQSYSRLRATNHVAAALSISTMMLAAVPATWTVRWASAPRPSTSPTDCWATAAKVSSTTPTCTLSRTGAATAAAKPVHGLMFPVAMWARRLRTTAQAYARRARRPCA